jgi:hypothetical protein
MAADLLREVLDAPVPAFTSAGLAFRTLVASENPPSTSTQRI